MPTLVVWVLMTLFFPAIGHWLRETIPGVTEVVELEGARLFFPEERADELAFHLRRHWQSYAAGIPSSMLALSGSA